jgi:hypothetical protein
MPWGMHVKEYGLCIFRRRAKEERLVKRWIECHGRECGKQDTGLMDEYSTNLSSGLA